MIYPRRWELPAMVLISLGLLIAGLTVPVMETTTLGFWKSSYSIIDGIINLWGEGNYILSIILFVFSIIFPGGKLISQTCLWLMRFDDEQRGRIVHAVRLLGKWSMLDVFVVAILVVVTQIGGLVDASPKLGIYLFGASIFLSMIATMLIEQLASQATGSK